MGKMGFFLKKKKKKKKTNGFLYHLSKIALLI
jgi:hypothetical protein